MIGALLLLAATLIQRGGREPQTEALPPLEASYLGTDSGDAILLTCGGHAMLIDTGYGGTAGQLIRLLQAKGVDSLDALVLTNFDEGHVGGAAELLVQLPVGTVYAPDYTPSTPSEPYRAYLDALAAQGLTAQTPENGEQFALGEATVTLYPPLQAKYEAGDYDFSLAVSVLHGNFSFLFPGDAGEQRLGELMAQCPMGHDVLTAPQHGHEAENSDAFFRAVAPRIVVITGGKDASPDSAVLDTLADLKADVYLTGNGAVTITSDGSTLLEASE